MDELIAFLENLVEGVEQKDRKAFIEKSERLFLNAFLKTINPEYVILLAEQVKTHHLGNAISRLFMDDFIDIVYSDIKSSNLPFFKKNKNIIEKLDYVKPIKSNQNILQVFISNHLNINDVYLNFEKANNFIVFLGENSQGKTSILQAISDSVSLENKISVFSLFSANNQLIVPIEYNEVKIKIKMKIKEDLIKFEKINNYYESAFRFFSLLAYGASRTSIQSPESMATAEKNNSEISHLMNDEQPLLNIEYWLRSQRDNEKYELIEQVFALLCELMPQVDKIDWERNEEEGWILYYYEKKSKYRLRELSAGQKTIVGLIGDMLIRLYKRQSKVSRPQDLEGIILIDELEAHLHPRWQQQFPSILKKTFPRVQFIVTTHSPMIVLGMPKDTLFFNVHKDEAGHVQAKEIEIAIETLRPNQILTSPLFGLENIRHIDNQGIEHLEAGDDYKEVLQRQESKNLLKQLAEKYKNKSPDA